MDQYSYLQNELSRCLNTPGNTSHQTHQFWVIQNQPLPLFGFIQIFKSSFIDFASDKFEAKMLYIFLYNKGVSITCVHQFCSWKTRRILVFPQQSYVNEKRKHWIKYQCCSCRRKSLKQIFLTCVPTVYLIQPRNMNIWQNRFVCLFQFLFIYLQSKESLLWSTHAYALQRYASLQPFLEAS